MRRPDTLPELVHTLVTDAPNGRPAHLLAEDLGKLHQTLLNEANPSYSSHKLGVEHLIPLARASGGERLVAELLARKLGGAFVDLSRITPEARCASPAQVMDLTLAATAEFGDVAAEVRAGLADGDLSPSDHKRLTHEIWEVLQVLLTLDAAARACAEGRARP